MHRHGYKGKKFGRERDQREALIKGLADSLILNQSIRTTVPKAKTVASYTEKLITRAKKGDLASRRIVISGLSTLEAAHKLVDVVAPQLDGRSSGYLRIEKTVFRRGDNAPMAKVSFVDELKDRPAVKPVPKKPAKKPAAKSVSKPKAAKPTEAKK